MGAFGKSNNFLLCFNLQRENKKGTVCCWLTVTYCLMGSRSHLPAHAAGAQWEPGKTQGGNERRRHGLGWDLTADGGGYGVDPGLTGMRELGLGQKCPGADE